MLQLRGLTSILLLIMCFEQIGNEFLVVIVKQITRCLDNYWLKSREKFYNLINPKLQQILIINVLITTELLIICYSSIIYVEKLCLKYFFDVHSFINKHTLLEAIKTSKHLCFCLIRCFTVTKYYIYSKFYKMYFTC